MTTEQRFWAKVDQRGPDECWPWKLSCDRYGYGAIRHAGKQTGAHRVAWEMANGRAPGGMCVCHRCDNRRCCNPAHLWLGTHRDNMIDCAAKGRTAFAVSNPYTRRPRSICCNGLHEYDTPFVRGQSRQCKECAALKNARRRQRRAEAA